MSQQATTIMILPILIYSKKMMRKVMEVIPPGFRKLWKEWDLRLTVLLSLILQIILIVLGHRRRFDSKLWIRIVVWSAYLAADSVATFGLGILSGNLSDMFDDSAKSLEANTELQALWAPFLLLHLGGPDTITAYALEDNELWLRHLVGLVVQTTIAFSVFLMAWTGGSNSRLSILSILMFVCGVIKYGERTWVLRSASKEKLRKSVPSNSHSQSRFSFNPRDIDLFRDENEIKNAEGYITRSAGIVSEVQLPVDLSIFVNSNSISDKEKLLTAYGFLPLIKGLFLDAILRSRDGDSSKSVFRCLSFENAFEVIEMELGFIYDSLYTKAPLLLYHLWGLALRLFTFFVTSCVLVLFIFLPKNQKYSKVDLSMTVLLLVVPLILEMYSALLMLISDRFVIWLNRPNNNASKLQALASLPLITKIKNPRWSHKICQLSFLSFSLDPLPCHKILKLLGLDRMLQKHWCTAYVEVPKDLKEVIFQFFKEKTAEKTPDKDNSFIMVPGDRGNDDDDDDDKLITRAPNFEEDLGNSILFWHIITEVLYHSDRETCVHDETIKVISRYMFYLLMVHPSMFSVGVLDLSSFEDTVYRVMDELPLSKIYHQACKDLVEFHKTYTGSDRLFHDAFRVVSEVQELGVAVAETWNKLGNTWLKILAYAGCKSKGIEHGQQLRHGGELLTHVWLLMAHFGLTDHFQISDPQMTRLHFT